MNGIMRGAPWCALLWAAAAAVLSPAVSNARAVRVLAFNAAPNTAYEVTIDGSPRAAVASTAAGTIDVRFVADGGETLVLSPANLQPPAPPVFASLEPTSERCVRAAWLPSGDPTVTGYILHVGTRSVWKGYAAQYDVAIPVEGAASYTLCDLPPGTYYAAVRARNHVGVTSAYSAELSVTVGVVPVLFSSLDANAMDGAVRLSWRVSADEAIDGFRIYRREGDNTDSRVLAEIAGDAREYLDTAVEPGQRYEYVVGAVGAGGDEYLSVPVATSVPGLALELRQNTPNPFNPSTRIPFTLGRAGHVSLRVYDVRGALVATLADEPRPAGPHTVDWDGHDRDGRRLASGVYVYVLTVDGRSFSRKMTLLK